MRNSSVRMEEDGGRMEEEGAAAVREAGVCFQKTHPTSHISN